MTIEKNLNEASLTVKIIGRLDTTTSPELEADMNTAMDGITDLVLDLESMEYISSAGLRVILKMQKRMNSQGSMKLIHANESVMEVFYITGFNDILTIE